MVELPIDGILDLHAFDPADVRELLPEYLNVCREKGIFRVRIIHGKGTGVLRSAVQDELRRSKYVKSFRIGAYGEGDSGVTIAEFR